MKKIFTFLLLVSFGTLMAANTAKVTCPTVTATPSSQTLCSGETTNIQLTSDLANTTFSWSVTQSGVSGCFSGSGNSINQTLTAVGLSSGHVVYTITPYANSCSGTPITVSITINPKPQIFASGNSNTICSGEFSDIVITSNISGTIYSWTVAENGVTGAMAGNSSINPVEINDMLTTIGNNPGTVTYTISPSVNGCSGNPITVTYNVIPTPLVTVNSPTVCSGSSATITATPSIPGTYSYAWIVPEGAANPGNVASFSTSTAGDYYVFITNPITECSVAALGTVTVLPSPDITATATNQSISSGDSTDISLSSNSTGATYQWTATQNNVTGATSGSGNTINQQLSLINTALQGSVTYTITASVSGGCSRNITDITIMVNPNLGTYDFNSQNFILSPNPVSDILNIKNNQTINKVTAFNQLGQMVLQKEYNNNEVQLDFSALKTGIYFISVDSDKKQSTFKIVKN